MTDDELVELVRKYGRKIMHGDVPEARAAAQAFREAGIANNIHVGKPASWFTRRTLAEWMAGQVINMVDSGDYIGMNAWCNTLDQFVPAQEVK